MVSGDAFPAAFHYTSVQIMFSRTHLTRSSKSVVRIWVAGVYGSVNPSTGIVHVLGIESEHHISAEYVKEGRHYYKSMISSEEARFDHLSLSLGTFHSQIEVKMCTCILQSCHPSFHHTSTLLPHSSTELSKHHLPLFQCPSCGPFSFAKQQ